MTDAFLAQLRQLLANAATAGAVRPRLVLYQQGGEVWVYLQADSDVAPGETWCTLTYPVPTAAAWPTVLDRVADGDQLAKLLDDPARDEDWLLDHPEPDEAQHGR